MPLPETLLAEKIRALPSELQREVEDFVEFLLTKRRRAELEQAAVAHNWPVGFVAHTAGSIEDPTFIRHPQGEPEERSSLE